MPDLFDAEAMYDEDYLRLFAVPAAEDPRSDTDAELIWRLAELRPGMRVLDLACGHGRIANRLEVERTIVRDGTARTLSFVVRLFGFPEIRDWLLAAGFAAVAGHGEDGAPLAAGHDRMVLHART